MIKAITLLMAALTVAATAGDHAYSSKAPVEGGKYTVELVPVVKICKYKRKIDKAGNLSVPMKISVVNEGYLALPAGVPTKLSLHAYCGCGSCAKWKPVSFSLDGKCKDAFTISESGTCKILSNIKPIKAACAACQWFMVTIPADCAKASKFKLTIQADPPSGYYKYGSVYERIEHNNTLSYIFPAEAPRSCCPFTK